MIFIGTDIVEIKRINFLIKKNGRKFLNHIYTENEQKKCNSKVLPSIHFSGRFAAKEAVKKAILSSNKENIITLKSIEILNDKNGIPIISKPIKSINNKFIKISISHTSRYATAMAIIEV